jgi:hypothetical protein
MTPRVVCRCLANAHIQSGNLGALWLELKVLRGLERGYLQFPDKSKVAKASLTLKANRCGPQLPELAPTGYKLVVCMIMRVYVSFLFVSVRAYLLMRFVACKVLQRAKIEGSRICCHVQYLA